MLSRRDFAARVALAGAAVRMLPEMAYAQRAVVRTGDLPSEMVWLNANENPAGIPASALAAMKEVAPTAWRYHYQEFGGIYEAMARSEDLKPENIIIGSGSSEVLHIAVDVLTSPTRPLITVTPTYEGPVELARTLGHPVILTKLRPDYTADPKALIDEAVKARGGLIYMCNPNNPTSAITTRKELDWIVANLPPNTTLLLDEAYVHFGDSPELASGLPYVRQGKDVIVTRTFSKIYGMAGLRVGFAAARPELTDKLRPLVMNVISIVGARAAVAALKDSKMLVPERRAALASTRRDVCSWLRERELKFIEPQANFMMIDVRRNAREFIEKMPKFGVAPGRPFPPLDNLLRVTIGTDQDMAKFKEVFWKVYQG